MADKDKTRYRSTFYYEGKRYEATGNNQKEADQKAAIKLDKLKRGEIGISGNMTVKAWANEWLETYKRPTVTDKSYKDYKRQIDKVIVPAIGSLRLRDVKDVHLQKIMNSRAGYSLTQVKLLKNTTCAIFLKARTSKLIPNNPADSIEIPKAENGTHRSITDFERERFLKAAATHDAGLMFKVMLYCGLRTGEVAALSWRDIDFERRMINVRYAVEAGSNNLKEPKTKAGVRSIPMHDDVYNELLQRKGDPFDPVFVQPRGKVRHTESSRRKAWDSLKKQIDISMGAKFEKKKAKDGKMRKVKVLSVVAPDFVPYCLRHTFCTDLQNKGVPINVAKYLMGHASLAVTANIYTHISDEAIEDAASRINGRVDKTDGGKDGGKQKAKAEKAG